MDERRMFEAQLKERVEPMSRMRKRIAQHMSASYFERPIVTLTTEVDMTEAAKLRKGYNERSTQGAKISFQDIIMKASAVALRRNALVNASIEGENIHYKKDVNIGFAVDRDEGLIVPVIHDADEKSLEAIAQARDILMKKIEKGTLQLDDISGGTFTVSNLGIFGIDAFSPIIHSPQSAILGIGQIVDKPVVIDGGMKIRRRMVLSLTHDHRILDGAPAARFLKDIRDGIENCGKDGENF